MLELFAPILECLSPMLDQQFLLHMIYSRSNILVNNFDGRNSVERLSGASIMGMSVSNRAVFNRVSKVIRVSLWFCFTSLCDWLKNLAPVSRPIRSKTQTICDLLVRVFPRLAPVTCICLKFWLVHWVICGCCDWHEKRSNTQLKTALLAFVWVLLHYTLWLVIKARLLSQPVRCKTKTNRDLLAHVFPRSVPVACICCEFWLVHCVVHFYCDWLGRQSNCFGLAFTSLNWKQFNITNNMKINQCLFRPQKWRRS